MIKLEPLGAGACFDHLFHRIVGGGAEHHQGVGHPGAPGSGQLTVGMGNLVSASGGYHHRETDLGSENRGGKFPIYHVPQEAGPEFNGLKSGPIAASG